MPRRVGSSIFSNRSFRFLFIGSLISVIGDHFTLVALPWLVLLLTGSATQLGLVSAVIALPRAGLMLVGGAVVDRMSPRLVLLNARAVNAALVGLLAALVLTGAIHMWMLYAVAAGIGLSTAFAGPANVSLLPQLLTSEQLQSANSALMGAQQLSMIIGPAMAGFVIKSSSGAAQAYGTHGTGIAFAIDALSFLFSLGVLLVIRVEGDRQPATPAGGILNNLLEGGRALWRDSQLRALIGYSVAVSVLVAGPMQVALPLLAKTRLAQGAAALGVLGTANGVGVLLGSMISGPLIRLTRGRLGLMLLAENALVGFAVAAMSGVHSLFGGTSMLVAIGLLEGTVQIGMLTWLQRRVPQALMGRTMSVLMLVSSALAPLSAAVAGSLIQELMLTGLLIGAGLSLSAIALFGLSRPVLRAIQLTAAAQPVAGE